ncbi:MAG TPA: hypothetical protein PKW75_09890 [candidate division Zixibacteria bacterium]|nr:hypothetical protein [candidate division Zixibacteria bacterium]MDD4917634.1 hypothetical protein [candidate division Zixibacteria bacterium]MDM7973443.1 hypothetical protein [candidate division Zixibacteria bacterium]HOD65548.1 hypothetical protein [candidate division Zixibacteria bacterium]HOZ08586.1 hypothetical protein [candidate division Zixibacteria bacterium]
MAWWQAIDKLDRRWTYLLVAIAVIIPFILPAKFPVSITPEAKQLYNYVEELPNGSVVMLVFDYYPSTIAECEPMTRTALHHLFRKDCKVVTLSNIPLGGPTMAESVTREMARLYGKVYGVDFVNLGYKADYVAVLRGMGQSIKGIFPADNSGTPLDSLPLMRKVKNYRDVAFIFEVADNATADYWASIVNAQFGVPMGCGTTAVSAPRYYAFVSSGQFVGLLGGMKGAAEYEMLVGHPGMAYRGMDAQSLVHLVIIGLVVVGNVGFFAGRASRRRGAR